MSVFEKSLMNKLMVMEADSILYIWKCFIYSAESPSPIAIKIFTLDFQVQALADLIGIVDSKELTLLNHDGAKSPLGYAVTQRNTAKICDAPPLPP